MRLSLYELSYCHVLLTWPGTANMDTGEVLSKVTAVMHEGRPAVLDAGSTLA